MKNSNQSFIKYRRQFLAFCISIIFFPAVHSEELTCKIEKVIRLNKNSLSNDIRSFINYPYVYYYTNDEWKSESRELKIFQVDIDSERKDSFIITLPEDIIIHTLPFITINNEFLILTDDDYFEMHRYKNINNRYTYINKIHLSNYSNGGKMFVLENNKFLFQSIYNYHPDDKLYKSNLGIYDANNDSIVKLIHPDVPCIAFSHLYNSWISVNENTIALAYPCSYKIILFDHNLFAIDSIVYNHNEWKDLPGNKIPFETSTSKIHPKILIDSLQNIKTHFSRIEKIFFINNSTLMVSSVGNNIEVKSRRIDLWKSHHNNSPVFTGLKTKIENDISDTILVNALPLQLNSPLDISITKNKAYILTNEDFLPEQNISVKEFNYLKDLYYEKNDPQFSILVYKIDLP
jgi:hypothetical protein